jgi:PAS domain S-box-containing protein
LTGYTKEELYMKNVKMLNSHMQPKEYYEELWNTINTGKVWRSEIINKRKNGELYNEEQTITPVYDKNNKIKNFISIKQDITERKRIEAEIKKINEDLEKIVLDRTQELINTNKALIESENKFRTLFEASGDAIILMDRNKFVDVNNETLNIFGIENKEEFLNLSLKDISPEFQFESIRSKDKIQQILSRIYELGTMKFEWVFKKKDGTEIITDNNLSIIEFKEERIIQAIIRDITEKKKAENILQETQLRLMEFEKMAALGEMVAGVAHEINTPIGIGVTAASFLDEKTQQVQNMFDKGELKKSDLLNYINLAVISSNSILINLKRAADLVKSFKQVAVDQSSQELRKFNVMEYMDDILLSLRPKLKRTNHIITIDCHKDLEIKNYPGAFSQIFTNLIVNSVIHGFERIDKGTITIEFEISEEDLIIKYSDNGRGIAKSKMNKIYEPFYSTKKKQGGTGLGLNIVYNLITQKLKGSIFCDSIQHSHTTFLMKIPLIK